MIGHSGVFECECLVCVSVYFILSGLNVPYFFTAFNFCLMKMKVGWMQKGVFV